MKLINLAFLLLIFWLFSAVFGQNVSTTRPRVVNIGALLTFNSTIGQVAKIAIQAAIDDVNADPRILPGSQLHVIPKDTNCDDGFLGMVEALQFMETDVITILGPQCSTIAHIVSFAANELKVPLLSLATDPTLSSLQYRFFVRAVPSDVFIMAAIADIVSYYGWKLVTAIYIDDEYGRNGVTALDDKLVQKGMRLSYKAPFAPMADDRDLIAMLVSVSNMESRVIVVHSGGIGKQIFALASQLQMVTGYVWIATDWLSAYIDSHTPVSPDVMNTIQGVVTLRQHVVGSKAKSSLASRWSSLARKEGAMDLRLNPYGLYAYDSVWMVALAIDAFFNDGATISFSNDPRLHDEEGGSLHLKAMSVFDKGDVLLSKIRNTSFAGVSGRIEYNSAGDLVDPSYDVINVVGTGMNTVGFWSNSSGLSITPPEMQNNSKPSNPSDGDRLMNDIIWPGGSGKKPRGWAFPYNGRELRIGVPYRHSFKEFATKDENTGRMMGYCIDVFTQAKALLPYAFPFTFVEYGNGSRNPNYDELVDMVATNALDAVVGDIAITMNRTSKVDFTQPFIESGLVILAPVMKGNSNMWAFLEPFTVQMWLVTAVSFIVVGGVVWILEHRINKEFRGPPRQQIVTLIW